MFAVEFLSAHDSASWGEPSAWSLTNIRSESREAAAEEAKLCDMDADGAFFHRVIEVDDEPEAEVIQLDRYCELSKCWVSVPANITRGVRYVR